MKVIMMMYDSLNRRYLEPYGGKEVKTPNFSRLAEKSVRFDTCYAGSMPCMPARRELHTGRHNMLHRAWGPLEPFDDSMPEILDRHGILSHLISDHYHYLEDGGATYHNRYSSWEMVRGQEGDKWKGKKTKPKVPEGVVLDPERKNMKLQNLINRSYFDKEEKMPIAQTFKLGEEFIRTNANEDGWFLQLECFDPHEPFFCSDSFLKEYGIKEGDPLYDWPPYDKVHEDAFFVDQARKRSAALHAMCDAYLGKLLDLMDEYGLWEDTMLIVNTDHGFMMGEHDWWAKNNQPCYDEIIHTPLFIYDPRSKKQGQTRGQLVATIDMAPTILEFFGIDRTPDMQGKPLRSVIENNEEIHDGVLFGEFARQIGVTDGKHVYIRAEVNNADEIAPIEEYTLFPTRMAAYITLDELKRAGMSGPLSFTKGVPVMKIPRIRDQEEVGKLKEKWPESYKDLLFDMEKDPRQEHPLQDKKLEGDMIDLLKKLMRENDAPSAQFSHFGLDK